MNKLQKSDGELGRKASSYSPSGGNEAGPIELPPLAKTLSDLNIPGIDTYRPRIIALGHTKWTDLFEWLARDLTLRVDPQSFSDVYDGSMSWVIRAVQPGFGNREVAIKVCKYTVETRQGALFHDEIATTAKLKHPGIPDILGYGVLPVGKLPYLVMHFIEGQTLAKIIEARQAERQDTLHGIGEKTLDWHSGDQKILLGILREAASIIQYAHSESVVHRDVKPSNVLVAQHTGAPFVIDFGLHSAPAISNQAGGIATYPRAGSPAYMAPEQHRGQAELISPATDVWGLGMTLLEVLTLTQPPSFAEGVDPAAILSEPHCKVPVELAAIVRRCLREDPKDRYQTAQSLADDLGRFLKHQPVEAFLREKTWIGDRSLYRWDLLTKRMFIDTVRLVSRNKVATLLLSLSAAGVSVGLYEYRNELAAAGNREAAAKVLETRREEFARRASDQLQRARDFAERG
jgi:serine/threonine protein kinase